MVAKKERSSGEKPTKRKEKLAVFLYDIAKLIFAALVLGAFSPIISNNIEDVNLWMVAFGLITTIFVSMVANHILKDL